VQVGRMNKAEPRHAEYPRLEHGQRLSTGL
jgi:hypothetical protein